MLEPSSQLFSHIAPAFDEAVESGDIFLFPSTIQEHQDGQMQFEICLCPALEHKPKSSPQSGKSSNDISKKPDPFAPPYTPKLLVGKLELQSEEFVVLLNKYCVVPKHFLLVTKEYKPQTSPLLPIELLQTYLLLVAARRAQENYLAFYNCGQLSGASQPHKHVQFLPVTLPPLEKLAKSQIVEKLDEPFTIDSLPYVNFVYRIPPSLAEANAETIQNTLADGFIQLLDLCISSMRHSPNAARGPPSYNFLLTLEHMHIIPRSREEYLLPEIATPLNVNSLGFAGMLLVKNELELSALIKEGIQKVLGSLGLPKQDSSPDIVDDI